MKNITLVMLVVMIGIAAWADDSESRLRLNGSFRTEVRSSYIASVGLVVHDDLVWENELNLQLGETGWYGGIWTCHPFEKANPVAEDSTEETEALTFENESLQSLYDLTLSVKKLHELLDPPDEPAPPFEGEIDYYIGYWHKFGNLKLDFNLAYYDFNKVGKYDDDQWAGQITATYTGWKRFEPYLQATYYGKTGSRSPEDGWYLYPGATFHLPLWSNQKGEEQTLDLGVQGAWSSGVLGMDSGYVYTRLSASTDFALRENIFLTPSIMYQIAGPGQNGGEKDYVDGDKWNIGLGVRFEF